MEFNLLTGTALGAGLYFYFTKYTQDGLKLSIKPYENEIPSNGWYTISKTNRIFSPAKGDAFSKFVKSLGILATHYK